MKRLMRKKKEKIGQRKATKRSQITKDQLKKHREWNKVAVNKYRKEKKSFRPNQNFQNNSGPWQG